MGFTFCLASLWALVGLSLLAFLWETLVYSCTEKSLLGTKENQSKEGMSWEYGQQHVARGIPAGPSHMWGGWPSLCTLFQSHSSEQHKPGLSGGALQRNGKWFSMLMAEIEPMGLFFFCHAQLLWKMYLFLNSILSCVTFTFYIVFWDNWNKPKQQTVCRHCIICQNWMNL